MLQEHAETFDILTRLRVKGLNLAIDDFGIGYSSLTKLFQMPFNEMKIDRSLIHSIPQSKEACIMVETLVELAHKLNLTACAEGVETEEAFAFLDEVYCDAAQGYLIGRPVPTNDVQGVIGQWSHRGRQLAGNSGD
jgi:EAL domain-containing protein (putative c-di-GMP-specific phosphodiesterase class I)